MESLHAEKYMCIVLISQQACSSDEPDGFHSRKVLFIFIYFTQFLIELFMIFKNYFLKIIGHLLRRTEGKVLH